VSASPQTRALSALVFLRREVLGVDLEGTADLVRARRGRYWPVVLSGPETAPALTRSAAPPG
jgi:hypothetical protein